MRIIAPCPKRSSRFFFDDLAVTANFCSRTARAERFQSSPATPNQSSRRNASSRR